MSHILVLGAGRSSPWLIKYLVMHAAAEGWHVRVADQSEDAAKERLAETKVPKLAAVASAIGLDARDGEALRQEIAKAVLVISLLPPPMHPQVAELCIAAGAHLVTASYVSPQMAALDQAARDAGVVLLNEVGVDPGIDHLSAMRLLTQLRDAGHEIVRFESFTGGLLAPGSEGDNPWKYKFTWNPHNVVTAGAGAAVKFLQEGQYKYIPYHRLFRRTEMLNIEGYGKFEGYANRDSLKYIDVYNLRGVATMYRGTLRRPGFCRAWDILVQLGATDDSYVLEGAEDMTYRQFLNSFLLHDPHNSVELKLLHYMKMDHDDPAMEKLMWLGLFSDQKITIRDATPAAILQHILAQKWRMSDDDKDMIVMLHKVHYMAGGERKQMNSTMVALGEGQPWSAMALTVGVTAAIGARMILSGRWATPGVHRPMDPALYLPMLEELEAFGVTFTEKEVPVQYESMF